MIHKIHYNSKAKVTLAKSISLFLLMFLLSSSLPVLQGADDASSGSILTFEKNFTFSDPEIIPSGIKDTISIKIDDLTMDLQEGAPQLPVLNFKHVFPYGTIIKGVSFDHSSEETIIVNDLIVPGPIPYQRLNGNNPILERLVRLYQHIDEKVPSPEYKGLVEDYSEFDSDIYNKDRPWGEPFTYSINVGTSASGELETNVVANIKPSVFQSVKQGILTYFKEGTLRITYELPDVEHTGTLDTDEHYDLLIITAPAYKSILQPLVNHKNSLDDEYEDVEMETKLVTLDEVYGATYFEIPDWIRDDQETIKYFIYQAKLEWDVTYVMAVGGYRSLLGINNPRVQFPVRMSYNHADEDRYYVAEPYYSCLIRYDEDAEEYVFDTWDSNGNDRFGEWDSGGFDEYDIYPDVHFARLACRNRQEAQTMVDKIIYYETETYGEEWFKSFMTITGDAFGDHPNLGDSGLYGNHFKWNINNVIDGDYTIYAQSRVGTLFGPIDEIHVTVDHEAPSRVTPGNDDHLKVQPLDEDQDGFYPGKPVAEIVVPQDNDVLGNTNVEFVPDTQSEFYGSSSWAKVEYIDGILKIKGKAYDPRPQEDGDWGSHTFLKVWINASNGTTVKETPWLEVVEYFEGEMEALHCIEGMPEDFDIIKTWTSNGNFTGMWDVIDEYSNGHGFVTFLGHSSCMAWGDHFPGIPGGRDDGMTNGIAAINLRYGLERYQAAEGDPLFPMDQLTNGYKLPVVILSGCHSGQFDTSLMKLFMDPYRVLFGDGYGTWTPEGMAWWMTRVPQGGSIATIGWTGFGYGTSGLATKLTPRYTGWLSAEFHRLYGDGFSDYLGPLCTQMLINFSDEFDPILTHRIDRKTFEECAVLGDPSLKIGGYDPALRETTSTISALDKDKQPDPRGFGYGFAEPIYVSTQPFLEYIGDGDDDPLSLDDEVTVQITDHPLIDRSPESFISDGDGAFLVTAAREEQTLSGSQWQNSIIFSKSGLVWDDIYYSTADPDIVHMDVDYTGHERLAVAANYIGSDGSEFDEIIMDDFTDPDSWEVSSYWFGPTAGIGRLGMQGVSTLAWYDEDDEAAKYHTLYMVNWDDAYQIPAVLLHSSISGYFIENAGNPAGARDESNGMMYFVFERNSGDEGYLYRVIEDDLLNYVELGEDVCNPDVAAADGMLYIIYEHDSSIKCLRSDDTGETLINVSDIVLDEDATNPDLLIHDDGTLSCFYLDSKTGDIVEVFSDDMGDTWGEVGSIDNDPSVAEGFSPFLAISDGFVWTANTTEEDDEKENYDLFARIFEPGSTVVSLGDIKLVGTSTIASNITNIGDTYINELEWEITILGDSPFGQFLGGTPILLNLFRGRIFSGGYTSDTISLSSMESADIASSPVKGLGHVMITITVSHDDEVLAEDSEDGFLLGSRLFLFHGVV